MKTIIVILFSTFLSTVCFAEKQHLFYDIYWEVVDDTVLVISGQGEMLNLYEGGFVLWCENNDTLTHIIIEEGPTNIGKYMFSSLKNVVSVSIPSTVTDIRRGAFEGLTKLQAITIPNSVTTIGRYAFRGCGKISSLWIPDSVTEIEEGAFQDCFGITTLRLSNSMTEISEDCFRLNSISSLDIPDQITTIGINAFHSSPRLKKVKLPASLTSLQEGAFWYNLSLDSVFVLNPTPPYCEFNVFLFLGTDTIHAIVPTNAVEEYENDIFWYMCKIIGGGYVAFSHTDTDDNNTVGGHVIQPEQRFYQSGEQATFTAIPAEGYRFVNWTTYSSSSSKAQVEVSTDSVYICTIGEDNVELTANFEKITSGIAPAATSHSEPVVYTQRRTIVVENTTAAVQLFDLTGRLVAQGIGAGSYSVPQAGVYIVKAGSGVKKVVVKSCKMSEKGGVLKVKRE